MRKHFLLPGFICISFIVSAQKKPLDHTVYDGWQSIGERAISNNGQFVVYTINPQEGDGVLVIQASDNSYKKEIARGYNATITEDNRYIIFRIKPFFKDSRDARIKKKTPDQVPKDSLGIIAFGKDSIVKIPRIKSYKTPEKGSGWLAYHIEKALPETKPATQPDSLARLNNLVRMADSLTAIADSLRNKAGEARTKGLAVLQTVKKETKPVKISDEEEGTDLFVKNLTSGEEKKYKLVSDYYFSKKGNVLIIETTRKNSDSLSASNVLWLNTTTAKLDTVMKKFNDAKNYALDEDGTQLAFIAERDSVTKALKKFYKLWYYKPGMDTAQLKADRNTAGVAKGLTIGTDYNNNFSKDGKRLFVGLAPIRQPKDTALIDFETARLDVWHYNDDYLQPQQLVQLSNELKRSFLAVINEGSNIIVPLADDDCETVIPSGEGNGLYALGRSTKGYRVQQQWEQAGIEKLYAVNTQDGSRKLIKDKLRASESISPNGKYILWYDWKQKNWFTYNTATNAIVNITAAVKQPLFDEEDDHPDDPPPHGSMGWEEGDKYVYVYDKYDIWKCDPNGKEASTCTTFGNGRRYNISYRYVRTDPEQKFFRKGDTLILEQFDFKKKYAGFGKYVVGAKDYPMSAPQDPVSLSGFIKAKKSNTLCYLRSSFNVSPNVVVGDRVLVEIINSSASDNGKGKKTYKDIVSEIQLSNINPQQANYNWFTVELHKWKMFDGKTSEGILYKPENFDSTKKYPVILYFYERDADNLYEYITPQPVRASINIPYFVSNGYIVFDPNIYYKTGQPGEDAYNSVVSAAKYLGKFKWVDTTKMAIQGHSWGGYQVAYLVTRTNMFAAAEAGAPVANMTSAYGGIRWGTGISRQFQYEHSQTRLGTSLWQKPEVFIKNSPLFRADKVNTPLLMMHNDADGAVPWYQGIEYFTALRRLGKKVWMMQYNGEDHGLLERKNRKDWSIRLGQFFDHFLKGAPAAEWIKDGVPAVLKGVDWGLETGEKKVF
jgi:dipeptidyl aminopeptidase/acylaminoacyl peptidase